MRLAENKSRLVGMKFEAQVVMRLKFQKQSALKFVSRIIQSRFAGIGNYPNYEAKWDNSAMIFFTSHIILSA